MAGKAELFIKGNYVVEMEKGHGPEGDEGDSGDAGGVDYGEESWIF